MARWHVGTMAAGDIILNGKEEYEIKEVLERRNHAGEFTDPAMKINSYFKCLLIPRPILAPNT